MPIIGTDVVRAARILREGKVVAFATETVYGLGACADNPQALATMYAMKNRPLAHPSIIHLSDFAQAEEWAQMSLVAQKLAAAFMPGALTLLLPTRENIKWAGGDTVALRVPKHPQALQLLAAAGAVAAPSANRFGRLSPTTAAHVAADFADEKELYILNGGSCQAGIESTIVAYLNGELSLLRPGVIDGEQISAVAGLPLSPPPSVAAPGRLAVHYAPQKPFFLATTKDIIAADSNTAVLSRVCPPQVAATQWRAVADEAMQYGHCLYALLRELDATDAVRIVAEMPPQTATWAALHDRIYRAAGGRVLTADDFDKFNNNKK